MEIVKYKKTNSSLYTQTLALRDEILRRPLGLSIYDENLSYEVENIFFGALENGKLIGTLNYFVKEPQTAQLCAFAVKNERQKSGIGSQLVVQLFDELQQLNFEKCIVEARDTAVGFYQKQGFTVTAGPIKNLKTTCDDFMMRVEFYKPSR